MPRKPYKCRIAFSGVKTCPNPDYPEIYEVDYDRPLHFTEPFAQLHEAIGTAKQVSRNGGEATVLTRGPGREDTVIVHYSPLEVALAELLEGGRP